MVVKKLAKKIIKKVGIRKKLASKGKIRADRLNRKQLIKEKKSHKKINKIERIMTAKKSPDGNWLGFNEARKAGGFVKPGSKAANAPWMKDRKDYLSYLHRSEFTKAGGRPTPWVKAKKATDEGNKNWWKTSGGTVPYQKKNYREMKASPDSLPAIPKRMDFKNEFTPRYVPIPPGVRPMNSKPSTTTNFIRGAAVGAGAVGTAWYAYDELQKEKKRKGK